MIIFFPDKFIKYGLSASILGYTKNVNISFDSYILVIIIYEITVTVKRHLAKFCWNLNALEHEQSMDRLALHPINANA